MPESRPAPFPLRVVQDPDQAQQELARVANRNVGSNQQQARSLVDGILEDVRQRGDAAVAEYTERFDRFRPVPIAVSRDDLARAWRELPENLRDALDLAHRRIQEFHQRQRPQDIAVTGVHGEKLGRRWRPVERAGLYVPGGRAAYPSTVLMNAVPAKVAGVNEIVICSPAGPDGQVNPVVLAAAHLTGVRSVMRIGGAQAVAAMAFGTESVPKVDVISGPGNLYVTLAKQAVYGQVGIDSLAGPSEVLVIADQSAAPSQVAADLLAQAEHDPLAAAVLVTTNAALAETIGAEIALQLEGHPRREICEASLGNWGLVVVCDDLETCARLSDGSRRNISNCLSSDLTPWPIASRMPGLSFSAPGPPKRWATTSPVRTTPCPHAVRPVSAVR